MTLFFCFSAARQAKPSLMTINAMGVLIAPSANGVALDNRARASLTVLVFAVASPWREMHSHCISSKLGRAFCAPVAARG